MSTSATLTPRPEGGTRLVYEIRARPRNVLGRAALGLQVGVLSRRRFGAVFRAYDALASGSSDTSGGGSRATPSLASGAEARIRAARAGLVESGSEPALVERLCELLVSADDLTVSRMRPYRIADDWQADRRATLELFLQATRHGLLELRWELLCPLCRGAAWSGSTLGELDSTVHCETCLIEVGAELDRSVEVTFRPAPSVRTVEQVDYCVAGPQVTPHVVAQQLLAEGERRVLRARLEAGRYRLRALALPGSTSVVVAVDGCAEGTARAGPDGLGGELRLATEASLALENESGGEQLFLLERTAWGDDAVTAAEVSALQLFRDLFASEALRPREPISVGSTTVVFTDLLGSTRYYRRVGDAPAFASVLEHVDVLRAAVSSEHGAVVKGMGDAIMAVFSRPLGAVSAMLEAQRIVAGRPLALKVGIHTGPCIAINQNGVLDYFGSTVNLAARLVALSSGEDLVISDAVLSDPEVALLGLSVERVDASLLKGFEDEPPPAIWRVRS